MSGTTDTTDWQSHYRKLENMYRSAPTNVAYYDPEVQISEGEAEISIQAEQRHQHSAGGVHGSVYFKLLDDACFFAANSYEPNVFVLTTSFTTYITRPVSTGKMTAKGKVVNKNRTQWIVEAVVYDEQDREIGRGNGIMVRSKIPLTPEVKYQ